MVIRLYSLANKRDKPGTMSPATIRKAFAPVCEHRIFEVFPISCMESVSAGGMPEAFDWLLDVLKNPARALEVSAAMYPAEPIPDMRSPSALSDKLDSWLTLAENDSSPEEFLSQFENICLPAWDHYTHIRIAYTILTLHGRQKGVWIFKSNNIDSPNNSGYKAKT